MSKIFEQLVKQRGLTEEFLHPRYEALTDPAVFPGMDKAVERIAQAINRGEKVLIFGDYDVDGVTASALMAEALTLAGVKAANLAIMLPNRFKDGYGMSPRLVERAQKTGVNLVITVDCGSRNPEIIEALKELGIDTIVTDHHECGAELPEAVAVINPKRRDFPPEYAYLRDLAGVGVAFKVAEALVRRGLIPAGQEKWLLDLVLIGTICDDMPMTRENRILCFYGVKVLQKTRRQGLKELVRVAGVRQLDAEAIGFQLGPRLNAAGRLETAELALDLVRARSAAEAAALAEKLEALNKRRRQEQVAAMTEIRERGIGSEPVIVQLGEWHEGVLGIVAGRLVEVYQRPAFVLTEVEKGVIKGSGRSFGEFNLAEALEYAKEAIIRGGGHAEAAGVSLESAKMADFRAKMNEYYRSLQLKDQERFLQPKADLAVSDLGELSLELLEELKVLEPFGEGHAQPIFRLTGVKIVSAVRMGAERQHLRLDIRDEQGRRLKLIAFFAPEEWLGLTPEDRIEPLVRLERNEFQGVCSVEGMIVDILGV